MKQYMGKIFGYDWYIKITKAKDIYIKKSKKSKRKKYDRKLP